MWQGSLLAAARIITCVMHAWHHFPNAVKIVAAPAGLPTLPATMANATIKRNMLMYGVWLWQTTIALCSHARKE
jgi:hypothetical protein